MSETFLSAVVEQTLRRVLSLISDEMITLASNLLADLRGIQASIVAVIDMLQDADEQRTRREPVRRWLIKLKEVAYKAEDVIDELSYEILRQKVHNFSGGILFLKKVVFDFQLAQKVKNLNQLLQMFRNEGMDFGLQWISSYKIMPDIDLYPIIDSVFDDQVLGRENEALSRIFSLLTDINNPQIFTVVPIVGTSAIWKTTLAELVCRKAMETNLFDVRIWVCASELSREQQIFHKMLQSLNGTVQGWTNKDVILQQLEKELFRKRFLLVLHDVEDDVSMWWDGFNTFLSKISTKTRNAIIVTTYSEQVAHIVDTSSQHTNITTEYGGAPMSAELVGGRMGFNMHKKDSWTTRDIDVMNAMPSFLKSCLEFCVSFPKDFQFQKAELIQFWMAEGLVESHDKGVNCFHALVRDSFLQEERDEDGDVDTYKICGPLHNHVFSLATTEKLTEHDSSSKYNTSCIRHTYATTPIAIQEDGALRTLILDGVSFQESWKLESLRTLCLNRADMEKLPSSVGRLKHLRHLDVSNTKIRALPEFITKLYNIQTLKFLECKELIELPRKKFNNLINLKNIAFSFERQMPFGLGKLKGLETLSFFAVGSDRGGSIKELECLNELRGHLKITRLEEVRDEKEAKTANLQQKKKLNGLSFQWSYGANDRSSSDEELLEGLRPQPYIQKLEIKYYMGKKWPSWMLRTWSPVDCDSFIMNNLVDLNLERCWNCLQLPHLGRLPCLKFLTIQHMERVKCIGNEFYEVIDSEGSYSGPLRLFPTLKSLSLSWMENLIEWNSVKRPLDGKKVTVFPLLETLSIQSCAKLTSFPVNDLSALVKVEIQDCNELRFLFREQQSFPSLTSLSIEGCPKLTYLPKGLLSSTGFNRFKVRRCEWLKFISDDLGLQRSLISLEINCCKGLTFFSEEILCKLTRLRKLSIGAFSEKLDDFHYLNRIKELPWLEELEIWGSDFLGRKMSHLPDQLQHLTRLESLKIMGFTTMEALPQWLSDLQSLRCLSSNYCWHLEYQSIATIIRRLSNLKHLFIHGCHTLEENKSQWNELSRISKIKIHFSEFVD